MPLLCEELLGGARNGHTALALLLLPVHVERKGERGLAEALRLRLQLLELALGDAAELKEQAAGRGALAAVDMPADHDGKVLLLGVGRHCARKRVGQIPGVPKWGNENAQVALKP